MSASNTPLRVALVLIGNELLSGKIQDANGHYATRRLRALGAVVTRVVIIPDERDEIVDELQRTMSKNDVVITSGGVGPTHDDITLECIAAAFDVPCVLDPSLEALINRYFKDRVTSAHLRMATVPEGCSLIDVGEDTWPIVAMGPVYVLPGVPEIFRAKFESLADRLRRGQWYLRSIYLNTDEGKIADLLRRLEDDYDVSIGSYPKWRGTDYRVRVTIEALTPSLVDQAVADGVAHLSDAEIVRIDPPVSPQG